VSLNLIPFSNKRFRQTSFDRLSLYRVRIRNMQYSGHFDEGGRMHGLGVLRYPSGIVYDGAFHEGKRHGEGKLVFSKGGTRIVFSGQWVDDHITTEGGKLVYPDGESYVGG
jgi:hypothetical protein